MKTFPALVLTVLLAGCAAPDVGSYREATPKLDLATFLGGEVEAWGMFQKRSGEVVKRFHVDMQGTVNHGQLTLDEHFRYHDGTTARRVWHLTQTAPGQWRGTAADVQGSAVGEVAGNALHWNYTLLLPVDGTTYAMQFDDWMYLIDACTMINRASMTKFGVELGQVTLMMRRRACSP